MLRHLINMLLMHAPPTRWFLLRGAMLRCAGIDMAPTARMCGGGWIYGNGSVSIGAGSWLSPGCTIYSHRLVAIEIGQNCDLGHEVSIVTGSHRIGSSDRRAGEGIASPVRIGDGCWIGARTLILGGSTIGAGTVVAAGSVVTGDLPSNILAAGIPARVKRELF